MKCLLPFLILGPLLVFGCANPPEPVPPVASSVAVKVPATQSQKVSSQKVSSDANRVYPRKGLKTTTVKLAGKPHRLWVMNTDGKRQEGMMFLTDEDVADDQGMLFSFRNLQLYGQANGFWMRNTILPLDIIYISKKGKVVNIGKGVPYNEEPVLPAGNYQYVIELKQGRAAAIGLKKGANVKIPQGVEALD